MCGGEREPRRGRGLRERRHSGVGGFGEPSFASGSVEEGGVLVEVVSLIGAMPDIISVLGLIALCASSARSALLLRCGSEPSKSSSPSYIIERARDIGMSLSRSTKPNESMNERLYGSAREP